MLILALDTTTRSGSAAVVRDGAILREHTGDASLTHGQRLPGELMQLLEAAHVKLADVDLFAVAAGPGSFTGLRVGIATVQGLAMATGRRVVPVSVLDALARAARNAALTATGGERDCDIATWMDAQRGEVFAAIYDPSSLAPIVEPTSASPAATLEAWGSHAAARRLQFIGDGAFRYRDEITARLGARAEIVGEVPPLAGIIGAIAHERASLAVLPHAVVPIYIRRPDAELARARRAAR